MLLLLAIIVGGCCGIMAGTFAWRQFNQTISKWEKVTKSPIDLVIKRLGFAISSGFVVAVLIGGILFKLGHVVK